MGGDHYPTIRAKYNFGAGVQSDWQVGSPMSLSVEQAQLQLGEGEITEIKPPAKVVHTMRALWSNEVKGEGFSRVTWEIEQVQDSCRLTVTHD